MFLYLTKLQLLAIYYNNFDVHKTVLTQSTVVCIGQRADNGHGGSDDDGGGGSGGFGGGHGDNGGDGRGRGTAWWPVT